MTTGTLDDQLERFVIQLQSGVEPLPDSETAAICCCWCCTCKGLFSVPYGDLLEF